METDMDGMSQKAAPSFEDSLAALEAAVHELEEGQLGLSDALARYEESVKHLKRCYQLLETAEQRIELLTGVAEDGTASTEPFVDAGEGAAAVPGQRRKQRARPTTRNGDAAGDIDG
jgi:exodeoxyribonuclease VII small subunit